MALTTTDRMRAFTTLGGALDAIAADRLAAAEAWVTGRIGCDLASASTTERLSGTGTALLYPSRWPVTSVTSLAVDGTALDVLTPASATDAGERVWLPPSGLHLAARAPYLWPEGTGNVLITYVAGYATVPDDLQDAVALVAVLLFDERTRIGQGSKTLGTESVQTIVRNAKEYQFIAETIGRYRRGAP